MVYLKKFISYYGPYRKLFIMDMFCALVVCIVDLAFPQILRYLTGTFYAGEASVILAALPKLLAALLAVYLIRSAAQYYVTSWGHIMGTRMETDMRQDLFDQYMRLSFSYYDQNNTGEMMSRLSSDLFDISELGHHGPENLLICTIKIVGSFLLLLFINVPMTLILLAVTILLVIFAMWRQKHMTGVYMDNRRRIADVNSEVQNSLAGIRVVKSFAGEDVERGKFRNSNERFRRSKEASYMQMGIFHGGNSLFQGLLYVAVLVSGGYFIVNGTLAAADMAIYGLYIGIFLAPIETLVNFTEMFQKGYAGFKRFYEVLQTQPDVQEAPDAVPLENVQGHIEFQNVGFHYEEGSEVLAHLSIEIPAGKTAALVGPSGGGKTTICSLLPRFYDVQHGTITIDGQDIRHLQLHSLRQAIGIVQQDVYIFAGSIRENIAYGDRNATEEEIIEAAENASIHDFIMSLPDGYDTYVGERGTRLSGGQKQRIAIARVFLKNPPILILDEATSALDNESERHIQASLERLSRGRTTIVIAHRLSTIRGAEKIIVVTDEGIEAQGSHEELLARGGTYARYYNMQFDTSDGFCRDPEA